MIRNFFIIAKDKFFAVCTVVGWMDYEINTMISSLNICTPIFLDFFFVCHG